MSGAENRQFDSSYEKKRQEKNGALGDGSPEADKNIRTDSFKKSERA